MFLEGDIMEVIIGICLIVIYIIYLLISHYTNEILTIIMVIIICAIISHYIENRNGVGKFKNAKEEKECEYIGLGITSIVSVFIGVIFGSFWAYFIPFVIGTVIGIPFLKYFSRKSYADSYWENNLNELKEDIRYNKQNDLLEEIDNMSGQDFEQFLIERLLPCDNYTNINGTAYSGDYGVDIIAEKDGLKCAIQCKRFGKKVNLKAIQEVVAGRKHYKCDKALVITNNYYTNSAKQLAQDNKIELLDRDYIIKLVKKLECDVEVYHDNYNKK